MSKSNINIPNLFGDTPFNSRQSVLQKVAELKYQENIKKIKWCGASAIFLFCVSIGFFVYQNQENHQKAGYTQLVNQFVLKNQTSFPIVESSSKNIQTIVELNKGALENKPTLDKLNEEVHKLLTQTQVNHLSQMDKIKWLTLRDIEKITLAHQISEQEFQHISALGAAQDTNLSKIEILLNTNKTLLIENSKLMTKRQKALSEIANEITNNHSDMLYYWLSALSFILSLIMSGLTMWLYVNNERQRLDSEKMDLMQENLNIASLANTIMEIDVNHLQVLPETEGMTGNLINSLNHLIEKFGIRNRKVDALIYDLNKEKDLQSNSVENGHLISQKSTIQSHLIEIMQHIERLNTTTTSNQVDLKNNELIINLIKDVNGMMNTLVKFPSFNNDEIQDCLNQIIEIDQDLSIAIRNLSLYAQNVNSSNLNSMNNDLAFGLMQEKLPNVIDQKIELNKQLETLLNNEKAQFKAKIDESNIQINNLNKSLFVIKEKLSILQDSVLDIESTDMKLISSALLHKVQLLQEEVNAFISNTDSIRHSLNALLNKIT